MHAAAQSLYTGGNDLICSVRVLISPSGGIRSYQNREHRHCCCYLVINNTVIDKSSKRFLLFSIAAFCRTFRRIAVDEYYFIGRRRPDFPSKQRIVGARPINPTRQLVQNDVYLLKEQMTFRDVYDEIASRNRFWRNIPRTLPAAGGRYVYKQLI